ncbi:MAG: ATP-dependent metallopeptidase FtsH/Yme1/Tma family protein, partial [Acidimicrobiales bacterium]
MDEQRPSQAPGPERRGSGRTRGWPRWGVWVVMGLLTSVLVISSILPSESSERVSYDQFLDDVAAGSVTEVLIDNRSGRIDFHDTDGIRFTTTGPLELSADDRALLAGSQAAVEFKTPEPGILQTWLPMLLPIGLIILFFWWINRRAQGQMGSMMSIGRSRAKTYSSELPGTTFDD